MSIKERKLEKVVIEILPEQQANIVVEYIKNHSIRFEQGTLCSFKNAKILKNIVADDKFSSKESKQFTLDLIKKIKSL